MSKELQTGVHLGNVESSFLSLGGSRFVDTLPIKGPTQLALSSIDVCPLTLVGVGLGPK